MATSESRVRKTDKPGKSGKGPCGGQLFPEAAIYNGVNTSYSKRIGTFPGNGQRPKSDFLRKGK